MNVDMKLIKNLFQTQICIVYILM